MFKNRQNLCKSVIEQFNSKTEWVDEVYLSEHCDERFLSASDVPEFAAEDIFMAGMANLLDGYHVERKGVDVHTILFTIEGGGVLITKTEVLAIEPYSIVVLPANTSFRFEINPQYNHWRMIWFLPKPTQRWTMFAKIGQKVLPFNGCERIWALITLLYVEIGGRSSYRKLLVSELCRLITGFESQTNDSTVRVQALFSQIEGQLHLPWTVKDMATKAYLSEEQLSRISKQLYGVSPRARLINLRMEKACDLLENNDWSVSMIAERLGYRDPFNFTHRFTKQVGCSPSAYRKQKLTRPTFDKPTFDK
ncbi:AraC family transcriptional regulator [Vibrio wakamikoensis]|jgi:AraC-like DNA-binding protein|uniref:Helix-turn-helix transcriptional regulator n=1 Tax=Vibrio chaetopteri TaxID=3016528 RepID=A0AAU8BPL0_9VIBR